MAPLRSLGNSASAFDDFYGRTGKDAMLPVQDNFSATGAYTHIPGNTSANGSDYFVFTGPGSVITNTSWEFEVLVVGAGGTGAGAGNAGRGGGGGAGGVQHYTNFSMESGTHTIALGPTGPGDSTITARGQSIILTAKLGGNGGAGQNGLGSPGGSGGGAGSRAVGDGNGTGGTATQPDQSLVSGMGGSNWGNDGGGTVQGGGSAAGGSAGSSGNAKAFPNFGTDNIGPALAASTHPYITTSGNYGKGGAAASSNAAGAAGAFYGAGGGGGDETLSGGSGYQGIVILRWIRGQSTL